MHPDYDYRTFVQQRTQRLLREYALRLELATARAEELGQGVLVEWAGVDDVSVRVSPEVPRGQVLERRVNRAPLPRPSRRIALR